MASVRYHIVVDWRRDWSSPLRYEKIAGEETVLPAQDIKGYRTKELPHYLAGNLLVLAITAGATDTVISVVQTAPESFSVLIAALIEACIPLSGLYIYALLLDFLVPSDLKMRLTFAFSALPGENVFDLVLAGKGDRFSADKAKDVYGDLYSGFPEGKAERKRAQNDAWYFLYKRHEFVPSIFRAQSDFLLCRDMFSMTLCLAVACLLFVSLGIFGINTLQVPGQFWLFLFVEIIATNIAARTRGRRFAMNVVAHDLSRYEPVSID